MREKLIDNFIRIAKIYRESGHEEKIADFFVDVATKNNYNWFKDGHHNVYIRKKGNTDTKPIALQAHLDMVCVKTKNSNHNFETEGIHVIIDGDKVTAKDTSLGADQGVGLAIMLTILEDKNLKHPDLEFIFTTEEETTFNGAVTFPYSLVESKRMINLDNSKDDSVFIGTDGDICNEYHFKGDLIENHFPSYKITIGNFPGGNSSENTSLSENNAITTMARLLNNKDVLLKSINGGTSENDLAAFCEVEINTNLNVNAIFKDINVKIENTSNAFVFSKENTANIINEILQLKCGYISKSMASANLGLIKTNKNEIQIEYVFRSMDEKELQSINEKTKGLNNNFQVKELYRDSIWNINDDSKLLKAYKEVYFNQYKTFPKEEIFHGALECAAIIAII